MYAGLVGNADFNITGIGADPAFSAGGIFGYIYTSRVAFDYEFLTGKQSTLDITCIGYDDNLSSIAILKPHIAGIPFNGKLFRSNDIPQSDITRIPGGYEIGTL